MFTAGGDAPSGPSGGCPGWLVTAVESWGENPEDAFDKGLVELGLGDSRLIRVQGAMLPMGFEAITPQPLPMGSLVECHLAEAYSYDGGTACAGVAWASAETPEGDECAIVATMATHADYDETEMQLRRQIQRRLRSRDLEVKSFDVAVDEATAGSEHHGVAIAALILPQSLNIGTTSTGRVRTGLTRSATKQVDTKAPAAPARRPGARHSDDTGGTDFSL